VKEGLSMKEKNVVLILGFACFVVMADNWVVSPILPAIAKSINVPVTSAALLITSYMLPFGIFQLIFGPLADRFGKKKILNLAMLFFTFGTALTALGSSLGNLSIYRALTGIFAASVMPVGLAIIGDVIPMEKRQSAVGTFMGISFLGQGLSMAIGGSIAFFLSWHGVFLTYSALAALSTLLLFTIGREIPSPKNNNSKFFAPYINLLSTKHSVTVYLVVLIEGILIVGTFSYLGAFIQKTYAFNYLNIGFILTAFGAAAVIGGRISGKLAQKWGRKTVLTTGLTFATIADILLYLQGNILGVLIIAVACLGLGFMLAHSTLVTIATEFAAKARGAAMSLVAFGFMGGGGVGTALGGKVIKSSGYATFFSIYGLLLLILTIFAVAYVKVDMQQAQAKNT
jgi:predicted MFS family arabinose efflux permease